MTKKYSKEHEWVEAEGEVATVGITEHAQEQLGELVFVELPEAGRVLKKGEESATVESVKAASEVYAIASGEVTEANAALADNPGLVNEAAEGGGWLYKLRLSDASELEGLMDEAAYRAFAAEGDG